MSVNLSRTFYSYETIQPGTDRGFSPEELEEAAISLCHALVGKYKDLDGNVKSVGGDMTKLRYVDSLSPAAKRLLQNIEHVSRTLPGSQEVRRLMRFDTQALRVRYGVPIFVTWSPDEKQSALFFACPEQERAIQHC